MDLTCEMSYGRARGRSDECKVIQSVDLVPQTLSRPSNAHRGGGSKRRFPGLQAITREVEERHTLLALRRSQEMWK